MGIESNSIRSLTSQDEIPQQICRYNRIGTSLCGLPVQYIKINPKFSLTEGRSDEFKMHRWQKYATGVEDGTGITVIDLKGLGMGRAIKLEKMGRKCRRDDLPLILHQSVKMTIIINAPRTAV